MKIVVACDHGGFPLREAVFEAIAETGNEAIDLGITEYESVDFPILPKKQPKFSTQAKRIALY